MRRIQLVITLLPLLFNGLVYSNSDTLVIYSDSLKSGPVSLSSDWRFRSGDNIEWMSGEYDDSEWDSVSSLLYQDSSYYPSWEGIGWFRKWIKIDSLLRDETVALTIRQYGASEIYLNGKEIHKFGTVSAEPDSEKIFRPSAIPVALNFDEDLILTI